MGKPRPAWTQEPRKQHKVETLRAEIATGRASRVARPADDVFVRLEAKYTMRAITVGLLFLVLGASCVLAQDDPAMEAEEAAAQAATDRADQALEEKAEGKTTAAEEKYEAALTRDKRKWLGRDAAGKSDADVNRLYEKKVEASSAAAAAASTSSLKAMRDLGANAQMKAATGKSMQEFMEMSPEEQAEWAAELEEDNNDAE